jgi:hypothetical protein
MPYRPTHLIYFIVLVDNKFGLTAVPQEYFYSLILMQFVPVHSIKLCKNLYYYIIFILMVTSSGNMWVIKAVTMVINMIFDNVRQNL